MKYSRSLFVGLLTTVFLTGLFLPFAAEASAGSGSWDCTGEGLNNVFCSITSQFRFLPKLLSLFSYVLAVILAISGLIQLKEYGDDPSGTPLRNIIIKLALAAMLISLPYSMQVFVTTTTGAKAIDQANDGLTRPSLGSGVSGR